MPLISEVRETDQYAVVSFFIFFFPELYFIAAPHPDTAHRKKKLALNRMNNI